MEISRMTAQAYAIADKALFKSLESAARPIGRAHNSYRPTDVSHKPVASLDEADAGQRVAVGWLRSRGYVDVRHDANGRQRIVIVRRPADPMRGKS